MLDRWSLTRAPPKTRNLEYAPPSNKRPPPPSPEKKTSFCTSYDIRDVYGTFNECDLSNSTKLMFIKGLVLSFVSRLSL